MKYIFLLCFFLPNLLLAQDTLKIDIDDNIHPFISEHSTIIQNKTTLNLYLVYFLNHQKKFKIFIPTGGEYSIDLQDGTNEIQVCYRKHTKQKACCYREQINGGDRFLLMLDSTTTCILITQINK